MRLAFCFLSNRDDGIRNLSTNFQYDMNVPPYIIDSYSKNILLNPPIQPDVYMPYWNTEWRRYYSSHVLDMFSYRQDSIAMAKNADIIFIGDDDMAFNEGSSQVINECCLYFHNNVDCGAIYLGGNFGGEGDYHKDEIYIANKGALGTNRGILVRNRPVIMDNRLHALGAMFDCVVGFTCLLNGFYVARRLHVPINHYTTTKLSEDHPNLFYNLKYIETKGIRSKIVKLVGEWKDRSEWPKGIFSEYRQRAMIRGFTPKYDVDGNIIGDQDDSKRT